MDTTEKLVKVSGLKIAHGNLSKQINDLKSAVSVLSVVPKLRNGSVVNPSNADAVACTTLIPIGHAKSVNVTINRPLPEGADHYVVRFDTFSVATGDTGSSTQNQRIIYDAECIYGVDDLPERSSVYFALLNPLSFAIDIFEYDSSGNKIALRASDFIDGDVVINFLNEPEFVSTDLIKDHPKLEALANNYDVGFNHFDGTYYAGIYPLNAQSQLAFNTNSAYVSVIVPVGQTKYLRYRSNQMSAYAFSYDKDYNFIKRSNPNCYAIDFVQNGYVIFMYFAETFDPSSLMIAYTNETSGATQDKWNSLFPNKPYEPYKLLSAKYEITADDFINGVKDLTGVTITTDENTGDQIAHFTADNSTKTWTQLTTKCKPMICYLLEFYGRCDYVDYSSDYTQGAMLVVEFYDANGTKIGEKYNSSVLGVGGRKYHRCGAISPYGAAEVRLRVVTRINGSMDLSNVTLHPVYGHQSRTRNGVKIDSHLGCIFTAPKNTMPSFEQAKIAGYNTVICNVKFTSDNVPVVIHDATIDATSDGTGDVSSFTYDQLQEYDFGSWFNAAYTGTKIPKLEDVLAYLWANGIRPAISLHGDQSESQLDIVAELFLKYSKGDCTIKSFSYATVAYMYGKIGDEAEYVWDLNGTPSEANLSSAAAIGASKISVEVPNTNVTQETIESARSKGVGYGAYGVYDTADFRRLTKMGVDRICMDFFSDIVVPMD